MMRAIVMSDSHNCTGTLRRMLEEMWKRLGKTKIDAYIHLGDGAGDFEDLESMMFYHDPKAQFHHVRGNCDFTAAEVPYDEVFEFGGANVFICHGQLYHVKSTLMYLGYAAQERGCTVALYGHTHVPSLEQEGGVTLINPGCARDGHIGLLEISDGVVKYTPFRVD